MIVAILGALTLAGGPTTDRQTPVLAAQPGAQPVAEVDPVSAARDNLERAEALYAQSCSARSYGSYDDLCNELSGQVHQYHVELDRMVRTQSNKKKAKGPDPQN